MFKDSISSLELLNIYYTGIVARSSINTSSSNSILLLRTPSVSQNTRKLRYPRTKTNGQYNSNTTDYSTLEYRHIVSIKLESKVTSTTFARWNHSVAKYIINVHHTSYFKMHSMIVSWQSLSQTMFTNAKPRNHETAKPRHEEQTIKTRHININDRKHGYKTHEFWQNGK